MTKNNHNYARKCMICGSSDLTISRWILRNNYEKGRCKSCNFVFAQPRPTLDFLTDYYNSISSVRFYKHSDEETLRDSNVIFKQLRENQPNAKKVLEIGGSTGYYLRGLSLRGYDVVGSELSSDAVKLAREWYGLEMYESEFPPEKFIHFFDAIIIHHVIEHLVDPVDFLRKANKYLVEGGIFVIETPNVNCLGIRVYQKHYPVFCPPGHLNFFSGETLQKTIPNDHVIENILTTSYGGYTIYNHVNGVLSFLGLKSRIDKGMSKKEEIQSTIVTNSSNNAKYRYLNLFFRYSRMIHKLFFPLFYILDRTGLGENLTLISRKKSIV
ncbi:MAG: class I SAM-dependent methyltransferase [Cyclobacteriaceae bacterium]|nr:class I SAM-dependent methyltransferase [Cyclobacteriaceae bacterium]